MSESIPVASDGRGALEVMEAAARAAGEVLRDAYGTVFRVDEKAPDDYVTEIDVRSEEVIWQQLQSAFPDFGFLGEESGRAESSSEWEWIVDPLDGTRNFIRRLPFFCVSIALSKSGNPVAGVVYEPMRDEMFSATAREGALLNGELISVSAAARLEDCVIGMDLGKSAGVYRESYALLGRLMPRFQSVRLYGSQALAMAYVAAGRIDLYFNYKSSPWDVAGGAVLVREADGVVSDMTGDELAVPTHGLVAGNRVVHEAFVGVASALGEG